MQRPTLKTSRLILRPSCAEDAPVITALLSDREIADTAMNIPYPFPLTTAQSWIGNHQRKFEQGLSLDFYLELKSDKRLIGALHIDIEAEHQRAELGCWIGKSFWNCGYSTEAAAAAIRYAFENTDLHRIYAYHLCRNPAAGRVLEKMGLQPEGVLNKHIKKWDRFEDIQYYGVTKVQ